MKQRWLWLPISCFMIASIALSSPVLGPQTSADSVATSDGSNSENVPNPLTVSKPSVENIQESAGNNGISLASNLSKNSDNSSASVKEEGKEVSVAASLITMKQKPQPMPTSSPHVGQNQNASLNPAQDSVAGQHPSSKDSSSVGPSVSNTIAAVPQTIPEKQGDGGNSSNINGVNNKEASAKGSNADKTDNTVVTQHDGNGVSENEENPQKSELQVPRDSESENSPGVSGMADAVANSVDRTNGTVSIKTVKSSKNAKEEEIDASPQEANQNEEKNEVSNAKEIVKEEGNQQQGETEESVGGSSDIVGGLETPKADSNAPAAEKEGTPALSKEEKMVIAPPPKKNEGGNDFQIDGEISQENPDVTNSYDRDDDDFIYDSSKSSMQGGMPYTGPSFNDIDSEVDPARIDGASQKDHGYSDFGTNADGEVSGADSAQGEQKMGGHFSDDEDSHFFAYFLTTMVTAIIFYLVFHNKQRIIALIIEGRAPRNGRSRRTSTRAKYHKLDNNLEEAITATKGSKRQ